MVIPKTTRLVRLEENLAVFDFALDDRDRAAMGGLDDPDGRLSEDPERVR